MRHGRHSYAEAARLAIEAQRLAREGLTHATIAQRLGIKRGMVTYFLGPKSKALGRAKDLELAA